MTALTTGLRVEFAQVNNISLIRVEGQLTDESLADLYEAIGRYSTATDARVSIVDLSSVSEFALSSGFIRHLADQKPVMADAKRRCFIVAREGYAFGLCRMFQLMGEATRPLLQIVQTLGEAFAAIGIQSPYFEPSVVPAPFSAG
jgi:anti-anti-sigma regulatory factor